MARRITILGMGPSSNERRHDIASHCAGTEIWGLNNGNATFPRLAAEKKFARFFELHGWAYLSTWAKEQTASGNDVDHWDALNKLGCEIITGNPLPFIQNQRQIDWQAFGKHWLKLFGNLQVVGDLDIKRLACYFRGSPSIMLALALWEHDQGQEIEYIQSWGIDTTDPQHACQRPSWSFWIGQALARGIQIGGTMAAFMFEAETDVGLAGLQELITQRAGQAEKPNEVPQ